MANKPVPEGVLGPLFDILSRPSRGIAEGTKRVAVDKGNLNDFLSGLGAGLSGKSSVSGFGDILAQSSGRKSPDRLQSVLGFGLDVFTDPLTYVSGGVTKGVSKNVARQRALKEISGRITGKISTSAVDDLAREIELRSPASYYVKFGGKEIIRSKQLADLGSKTLNKFTQNDQGYRTLAKAFNRKAELPHGLDEVVRLNEMNSTASFQREIDPLVKLADNLTAGEARTISEALDRGTPEALKGLLPSVKSGRSELGDLSDYATLYKTTLKRWFKEEESLGLRDPKKEIDNYLPKYLNSNLKNVERRGGGDKYVRIAAKDLESPSIAVPAQSKSLEELERLGFAPDTDIRNIIAQRGAKHYSMVSRAKSVQDIIQEYGILPTKNNKDVLFSEDFVPVKSIKHPTATRSATFIPRSVADSFNSLTKFFDDDHTSSKILKGFDRVLNEWKFIATATPQTRIRNLLSDFIMNAQDGVVNPEYYVRSRKILQDVTKANENDILGVPNKFANLQLKGIKIPTDKLWRLYAEGGKAGFVSSELYRDLAPFQRAKLADSAVAQKLNPAVVDALSQAKIGYGKAKRVIGDASDYLEDFSRVAHFTKALEDELPKGLSTIYDNGGAIRKEVTEAALRANRRVRKFNLDYGNLTQFEKGVARRVVPFYSFMRQAIPQQVGMLFSRPGFMALYPKGTNLLSGFLAADGQVDDPLVPQWIRELSPFKIASSKQEENTGTKKLLKFLYGGTGKEDYVGTLAGTPVETLNRLQPLMNIGQALTEGKAPSLGESLGSAGKELLSSSNPLLKAPVELGTGKNVFTGQDISQQGWTNWLASQTPITRVGYQGAQTVGGGENDAFRGSLTRLLTGVDIRPVSEGQRKGEAFRQLSELKKAVEEHSKISKGKRIPTDDEGRDLIRKMKVLQRDVRN